jgi:hypothetical protein
MARLNVPEGFLLEPKTASIEIKPREEAEALFKITVPKQVTQNIYVITSDIKFENWDLRQWCEFIIEVYP